MTARLHVPEWRGPGPGRFPANGRSAISSSLRLTAAVSAAAPQNHGGAPSVASGGYDSGTLLRCRRSLAEWLRGARPLDGLTTSAYESAERFPDLRAVHRTTSGGASSSPVGIADHASDVTEHSRIEMVLPKHGPTDGADS